MSFTEAPAVEAIREKGHESVTFVNDRTTGLRAIIAVHDTSIGPSLGGCRMRNYGTMDDALKDVLRLSEAMSFKNSLCGINVGGGKSVIISDGRLQVSREEFFQSFGRHVGALNGTYIAAEDMGTSVADMSFIGKSTKFVAGTDPKAGGGGDPSPYTARGVVSGMKACFERAFGSGDFTGRHIVIQGAGNVGYYLCELLVKAGAKVTVTDSRQERIKLVQEKFGVNAVSLESVYDTECDIFAPCAVGATINARTVPRLRARIVAGAANNQLETDQDELHLRERHIMYAPDFAINAGGVILCADEFEPGGYNEARVDERVARIYGTVGAVLDEAAASGDFAGSVALRLARQRLAAARESKIGLGHTGAAQNLN